MQLSSNDLKYLCEIAISAALQAGAIIREKSAVSVAVQSKKGGESLASQVVTEVDLMSQDIILKSLIPTCKEFDLALLSEEQTDDGVRLQKDYFWSIDPLDGTLPFIEKTAGYAVSIALVSRSGRPMLGVIYDPVEQTLYHAVNGQGAFRNKKAWILKPSTDLAKHPLTVVSDRSFVQQSYYSKIINELETIVTDMGYNGLKLIQIGGAAMNACWVLENNPGCYFKFPKTQSGGGSLWDYAATACVFNEIGAVVSDIHGNELDLNREDSSFMNHHGILYCGTDELSSWIQSLYRREYAIKNEKLLNG
ncbi:MAG: inositol monophosphatase [Gammaproteobacteria bacterium]|jgi:3'(2'), 5'-bisphosphate nucleotidase/myo-inositol-1(or 4)-monophosphatase|nr:inositol monophosphatase [Gammaproteobacteria bacterium]MBT3724749.1 inositol monophosphatase [Gammaproteobacteria bacterium]MBT4078931.1 inositol monophosphatase [Gammaproteobacteria bacterium]MBT4195502.1 inositol monophosphatase [Gammaproteobacteria bacterium]MBT4448776.1 inositol monophosphatase [Gammaproteobacteria bacterium]